ncbi:hypothetical protein ACLQ25_19930 [Micromonospora sp. DT44]
MIIDPRSGRALDYHLVLPARETLMNLTNLLRQQGLITVTTERFA